MPLAHVTLEAGQGFAPIGVFGRYASLNLQFSQNIEDCQVWAQDLAGKDGVNITDQITIKSNSIKLDGNLLEKLGLNAGTSGDLSEPGLVLKLFCE